MVACSDTFLHYINLNPVVSSHSDCDHLRPDSDGGKTHMDTLAQQIKNGEKRLRESAQRLKHSFQHDELHQPPLVACQFNM